MEQKQITEKILEELGFQKVDMGWNDYYYYCYNFSEEPYCDLALVSGEENGFLEVCLFPYDTLFRYRYVDELERLLIAIPKSNPSKTN